MYDDGKIKARNSSLAKRLYNEAMQLANENNDAYDVLRTDCNDCERLMVTCILTEEGDWQKYEEKLHEQRDVAKVL